jgi:hypothetical protein
VSPYYWASFILLGEDDVIKHSTNKWIMYVYVVFGLVLILVFYKIIGRKKSS